MDNVKRGGYAETKENIGTGAIKDISGEQDLPTDSTLCDVDNIFS